VTSESVRPEAGSPADDRRRAVLGVLRPLPWVAALGWIGHAGHPVPSRATHEPDLGRAIAQALESRSLAADPAEVLLLDRPPGLVGSLVVEPQAIVRARKPEQLSDIYLLSLRLSPENRLLDITRIHDLTDTSAVDERQLAVGVERAAWVIGGSGRTVSVHYADLRGEPTPTGPEWTRVMRWQDRLTNLQETGQLEGIRRRTFRLEPAAERVTLSFSSDALLVDADGHRIRIPTDSGGPIEGARYVQEQVQGKARPGNLVTWAVDRARELPWFGNDRMQLVKAVAFTGLDWVDRLVGRVTGDDGATEVAAQLGELADAPPTAYTDPETGWPPPPMQPVLGRPLKGEGQWHPLDGDPFIRTNPGAPSPFVTSFIRTDPERAYAQIYVLLWDPRQVSLHAMSGTLEPKSATGETGPGLVPRRPEVMGRLLGGLNGGFQANHGEFGMMAERVVYLPPKPYAATVAELSDGSTGFGTWPRDENVPDNIVSFRQNMTPMVMDGTINPYRRAWWGGVPPGWTDESRTVRSAICMTKEGHVAYFYGSSTDAERLTMALTRARCTYGIHLDMNAGHTGLEFYRAAPEGELPKLDRPLDPRWEAEGPVSGMPGWRFLGRRMMRFTGLMNFPRYIQRESRDFFYLTLRPLLPASDLAPRAKSPAPDEGKWQVKGLPQHGWPYALATAWLRPDPQRVDTKVRLVALDPRMVTVTRDGNADAPTVVALPEPAGRDGPGLFWVDHRFVIAADMPGPGAERILGGFGARDPGAERAVAGLGIDERGMLLYAEVSTAPDPSLDRKVLAKLLGELGCRELLWLGSPAGIVLGGELDLAGRPVARARSGVRLVRSAAPGAVRIFPDTPVVPPSEWYPLQAKRVRYVRKPKPRSDDGPDAAGGGQETRQPGGDAPSTAAAVGRDPAQAPNVVPNGQGAPAP
jgi:hypothetical protein